MEDKENAQKKAYQGRFTEQEFSLIKSSFSDDNFLKTIRKVILQIPLNALDQSLLELNLKGKKEVNALLRKCFLPDISNDQQNTLFQVSDFWVSLDVSSLPPQDAIYFISAQKLQFDYIKQQLKVLEDGFNGKEKIKFKDLIELKADEMFTVPDVVDIYSRFVARNMIVRYTQTVLNLLYSIAIQKSPEELEEKRKKDSSK